MCTIKRLKKLVKVLDASKEKAPEMLYQGDFVRFKPDGEVYIVTVLWDHRDHVYMWGFVSLEGTDDVPTFPYDWVASTSRCDVLKSEFWEDNDPDWEVINLREDTEDDKDC